MLNFNLIFVFSTLLLSCSSAKNTDKINKDFTIISAQESTWFGGREGVKGTTYSFILKNNQKENFHFTNLHKGKNLYPLRTKIKNDSIFLSASVPETFKEPTLNMETGKKNENTKEEKEIGAVSLDYLLSSSKTIYSIPVQNIKEKVTAISGEALPN